MKIVTTARISMISLGLIAAGCTSNQDRSDDGSPQNSASLQSTAGGGANQNQKEIDAARIERDRYKSQLAESNRSVEDLKKKLADATAQNEAAQAKIKSLGDDLAKANADLEAAKKNQGDSETMNARLKAAEDGVTAARAKAADADKAAAAAATAEAEAKKQVQQLTEERNALQAKVKALQDEVVRKSTATPPPVPDLNK
jgi:chromosome segregation ATPase